MKIGTIKGIKIKLHFSTLLIVALVGFYAASLYYEYVSNPTIWELLLVGIINGVLILVAILIHELAHSIMALRYGIKVSEIELYLFGGVSKMQEEPKTPKSEFNISIVGPLSSFILGAVFLTFYYLPIVLPAWVLITLFYSGITNIGLGIFNLLPAFPMDGGRVLRAFLWNRRKDLLSATKTASKVGSFFGYTLMVLGFIQMLFVGIFAGFWLILMGIFLNSAAKNSYTQTVNDLALSSINIKELLVGARKFVIPFELPLIDALRDYFMIFSQVYFPVVKEAGNIIGIIHFGDIRKIPIEQRSQYKVGDIMIPIDNFPTIHEEGTGKEALRKLIFMEEKPQILVVQSIDQEIIGFFDERELLNAIKLMELRAYNY
jgi:Zn-dependent protease/CBS domain-containing protein